MPCCVRFYSSIRNMERWYSVAWTGLLFDLQVTFCQRCVISQHNHDESMISYGMQISIVWQLHKAFHVLFNLYCLFEEESGLARTLQTCPCDYFSLLHARSIEVSISLYFIKEEPWSKLNENFGNFLGRSDRIESSIHCIACIKYTNAIFCFD